MARVGGRVLRGMAVVSTHQDWQWEEGQDMLVNLSFEYLAGTLQRASLPPGSALKVTLPHCRDAQDTEPQHSRAGLY